MCVCVCVCLCMTHGCVCLCIYMYVCVCSAHAHTCILYLRVFKYSNAGIFHSLCLMLVNHESHVKVKHISVITNKMPVTFHIIYHFMWKSPNHFSYHPSLYVKKSQSPFISSIILCLKVPATFHIIRHFMW